MSVMSLKSARAEFQPDLINGFHQTWYVVCLASELIKGKPFGKDFLGGRVVVYRKADGAPVVMSAFCPHLGADLSRGALVGDNVRCAFHHFQFAPDGVCVAVHGDFPPPRQARLFSYPAIEHLGAIWAFNGSAPLAPPEWPTISKPYAARAGYFGRTPIPPWIINANSFDLSHLQAVHGANCRLDPIDMEIIDGESIAFQPTFILPDGAEFKIRQWQFGTNTQMVDANISSEREPVFGGMSSTPLPDGTSDTYLFAATDKGEPFADEAYRTMYAQFEVFIRDDMPIFQSLKFIRGAMAPSDRSLGRFLNYVHNFPKADPAGFFS